MSEAEDLLALTNAFLSDPVVFGDMPSIYVLGDLRMELLGQGSARSVTAFYDIKDANSVYQLVSKLRSEPASLM